MYVLLFLSKYKSFLNELSKVCQVKNFYFNKFFVDRFFFHDSIWKFLQFELSVSEIPFSKFQWYWYLHHCIPLCLIWYSLSQSIHVWLSSLFRAGNVCLELWTEFFISDLTSQSFCFCWSDFVLLFISNRSTNLLSLGWGDTLFNDMIIVWFGLCLKRWRKMP